MQLTWRKTFASWLYSWVFPSAKAKTKQTKTPPPFRPLPQTQTILAGPSTWKNTAWNKPGEKYGFKSSVTASFHHTHLCTFWGAYHMHLLRLRFLCFKVSLVFWTLKILFYRASHLHEHIRLQHMQNTARYIPPTTRQMLGTRNMQGFFMLEKWWKSAHQR